MAIIGKFILLLATFQSTRKESVTNIFNQSSTKTVSNICHQRRWSPIVGIPNWPNIMYLVIYLGWIAINLDKLRRFISDHFRWFRTNFPMDFMSRGHQVIPNGSFSSFDSERLHFHFFQSSIFLSFLLSPKMKSSVFDHTRHSRAQWYIIHPIVFLLFE